MNSETHKKVLQGHLLPSIADKAKGIYQKDNVPIHIWLMKIWFKIYKKKIYEKKEKQKKCLSFRLAICKS